MMALVDEGKIDLVLGQVTSLVGADGKIEKAIVKKNDGSMVDVACDVMLPFFGLTMKLGPVANWGFELKNNELHPGRHRELSKPACRAFSPSATSTGIPASSS